MSHDVLFEPQLQQFRVHLESNDYATIKFTIDNGVYSIVSASIPEALRGKGYGKIMMEALLPELEKMDVKIIPICSYVVHYLKRHPQWHHLNA